MKTGTWMELNANLKALNLSTMARNLEVAVRQARESGLAYDDFLLELTAAELQARADNSLHRRVREAKFPFLKPVEAFDLSSASGLDLRLFRDLVEGSYIKERRNVIFWGSVAGGKPIWP